MTKAQVLAEIPKTKRGRDWPVHDCSIQGPEQNTRGAQVWMLRVGGHARNYPANIRLAFTNDKLVRIEVQWTPVR